MLVTRVPYVYTFSVARVVDGDTLDAVIDVGFRLTTTQRIRLAGIDTPELRPRRGTKEERAEERNAAERATMFAVDWLHESDVLLVETTKGDAFGRWLGTVYRDEDEMSLNEALLDAGHAVIYAR